MLKDKEVIIDAGVSPFNLELKELWYYKDLLGLFIKRDFITTYKQTILGPLWFGIQPILTALIFTVIFNKIANISTSNIPPILFYLSGITFWNYFSDCLTSTSKTFIDNQHIFGKVYFPRLIIPLSKIVSNLLKLGIQLLLFLGFYLYYYLQVDFFFPNIYLLLFPLVVLNLAFLGLGCGLIISAITTKYRDLLFLVQFGVQLWMYITPVIYPLSTVPEKYKSLSLLNPITSLLETLKFGLFNVGTFSWSYLGYSLIFGIVVLIIGMIIFKATEKDFMDTV